MADLSNRRPIAARSSRWVRRTASGLARAGVSANGLSAVGLLAAIAAGLLLALAPGFGGPYRPLAFAAAALLIGLRLFCNLLDGLVAVEEGKATASGPIWNELPDRFSDVVVLVGAGYGIVAAGVGGSAIGPALGWGAGVLAVLTAYLRELGRGLGFAADFGGPLAKSQRMAVMIAAAAIAAWLPVGGGGAVLAAALGIVVAGTAITLILRTRRLVGRLAER